MILYAGRRGCGKRMQPPGWEVRDERGGAAVLGWVVLLLLLFCYVACLLALCSLPFVIRHRFLVFLSEGASHVS